MENCSVKKHRLSGPQGGYLMIVHQHPGISQDAIAKTYNIDKSSVARAVKKLEVEEYIYRERNPKDSRQWCIYLTSRGETLCIERQESAVNMENRLLAGMTEDEIKTLRDLLAKVTSNMEDMSANNR